MKKSVILSIVSINGKERKTTTNDVKEEEKIPTQTANQSGDDK